MTIERRTGLLGIVGILFAGCAQWSPPPAAELAKLPVPQLAPDSVVLEVSFVRIPDEVVDFDGRFWAEADESVVGTELRRYLAANGFRCGVVSSPPPPVLQELLDRQPPSELMGGAMQISGGAEIAVRTHRLRSRAGQPGKIALRPDSVPRLAALLHDPDGRVHGETFEQAQCYLSVTTHPQANGQTRVELVPLVEHGQPRSRFKGQQGAWIVDNTSRSVRTYDALKVEAPLAPGQCLAVGVTDVRRGLGDQFLGGDVDEKEPRLLLLVRLAQTQRDERFMDDSDLAPLLTTTE